MTFQFSQQNPEKYKTYMRSAYKPTLHPQIRERERYLQRPRSRLLSLAVLALFTQAGLSGLGAGGVEVFFLAWVEVAAAFFGVLLLLLVASSSSHVSVCFLFFLAASVDFFPPLAGGARFGVFLDLGD